MLFDNLARRPVKGSCRLASMHRLPPCRSVTHSKFRAPLIYHQSGEEPRSTRGFVLIIQATARLALRAGERTLQVDFVYSKLEDPRRRSPVGNDIPSSFIFHAGLSPSWNLRRRPSHPTRQVVNTNPTYILDCIQVWAPRAVPSINQRRLVAGPAFPSKGWTPDATFQTHARARFEW